jgi:hypothetical protein
MFDGCQGASAKKVRHRVCVEDGRTKQTFRAILFVGETFAEYLHSKMPAGTIIGPTSM